MGKAMLNDLELLEQYAAEGCEDAFRAVLDRHLGLVYSAAVRQVHDPHLAEEITQAVFVVLARKAGSLRAGTVLAGWLFRTTRFVAARAVRDRQLRQLREQEAAQMQISQCSFGTEASWDEVAAVLDEALLRLGETERHAILLRFFEKKELKEVGQGIGSTEEGARKRVSRALEKLRRFLVQRGVVLSTATLAGALAENSVHAAPAALSASTFAAVTANAGTATTIRSFKARSKRCSREAEDERSRGGCSPDGRWRRLWNDIAVQAKAEVTVHHFFTGETRRQTVGELRPAE
jgi:RNA polymerase sigma factor (sigma-70 family)